MERIDIPFNISLLHLTPQKLRGLGRITALDPMEGSSKDFHPAGLFSVDFFGRVGDERRSRRYAFIDVKISVFHPLVYATLVKLKNLYGGIMSGTDYALWDKTINDFVRTSPLEGETGFSFFVKHWEQIQFNEEAKGLRRIYIDFIKKTKEQAMTNYVLVMPAGLREMELDEFNRIQEDEVNQIYRRILSYSNTITEAAVQHNPQILDAPRAQIQNAFNNLYENIENLIKGKKKLLLGKWATRRIFNGTRNVITSMDTSVSYLGATGNPTFNSTIIGLYQYMKGSLPKSIHDIKQAASAFIIDSNQPASLVDKKTLTRVSVDLTAKSYNQWLTVDGIERIISTYSEESVRMKPLEIEGHYLALIYKGPDGTFKIFQDIRDLPKDRSVEHVTPITVMEFLLCAVYYTSTQLPILVTRYPVTGIGSIYPSKVHLRATTEYVARRQLDEQWLPMDDDHIIHEFPNGGTSINSLVPHSSHLVQLGADFDGDTASGNIPYSDEAIKEIHDLLNSPQAYLGPDGRFIDSVGVSTINLVMFNMTGDPA